MSGFYFQPPWPAFVYQGTCYDLGHLNECILEVIDSEGENRRIVVTFTDHCFTREAVQGDDSQLFYPKSSRSPGCFCVDRYRHSLTIAGHLNQAISGRVWYVDGDNYAIVPTVDHNGNWMLYGIIFSLDKVKGLPVHLHMRIKSAYPCAQKEVVTFGEVRFKHLVKLRMQGKHPPRNMDNNRKRPILKMDKEK